MKRVKCYGKKETRLIETSATKRFFGDLSKNLSNSYEDKSIQAHVCEDHNLEKSSEQGLSKSRNGFNNDDSDILANWRMPFFKFKYGKCKIKKSPTKKKYCKIGKQKNISKNISSARKSPTKKKYCKIERKKISKNVTSTPASNKTINLNAYFDKKFNNETAVSVESSNEKLNQKKAVDSSPENLSVRSYILSSDDTGICIMNDGSVHHLIKTSINVTPLTKRQLRYNLILSSNIRNKMKQSRKKLKLHNSAEHSVNIEDSSSELEIVLNEDVPKYVTCNTGDKEVFHEEDNNLVLNEDNNKYMTLNSVTYNTSENENNIEETEQNSKLQNSDEHVINFENNCVLSLLNLKEVKKVNSVTCNIQYGCGISTHMNMKESKACNLHDQGNEDIPKYVTYNTGHKEDNNKYVTLNSVTCNTSEKENNIEETEQNSKLQSSAEHIINFKNECALSLLSLDEIKKEDERDEKSACMVDACDGLTSINISAEEDNKYVTLNSVTCNTSEKQNNIEETEQNSKLQSSDERMINFENDYALSLLSVDEIKKEDETDEKSAIMIEACDGLFKTTAIKIQNIYLKKQETTSDQVSGDQVSEMTPLFQNKKTLNKETIIQAILKLTSNKSIVDFNEAYEWSCYTAQRMGGSSFAELFSLSTEESKQIIKIIVVESEQIKLMNLLAEVKIFKCLNMLRNEGPNHCMNFCELKRVMMVRGEFPSLLKEAWVDDTSDSYAFDPRHYDATQMYLIFEMADGGTCLSHHMPKTQKEALSIMLQVGLAMAIAEEALLFEHRDLHSENILVKKTDESLSYFILRDYPIVVPNLGWEVTIIDFSLSKVVFNGNKCTK
ncbi:uncharacterized protein LOC118195859 [Stegodyphus dumicola]|uniref:uncharacterized protein LOC118195859 n=1 Tax=Stegodyphus dumicola TaxID=202533 RepID=UPI0015AFA3BC|nr:uncharacterized protein LOC118195859 [Stegodyphus dumicola]